MKLRVTSSETEKRQRRRTKLIIRHIRWPRRGHLSRGAVFRPSSEHHGGIGLVVCLCILSGASDVRLSVLLTWKVGEEGGI
jgi:hypothetical protein